jgi:hypothetical protein
MSSDALFQLGMDLDHGSSTAQTEEKLSRCPSDQEGRKDFFCERDGVRYAGTHLIIDLVRAKRLDDLEHIEQTLRPSLYTERRGLWRSGSCRVAHLDPQLAGIWLCRA